MQQRSVWKQGGVPARSGGAGQALLVLQEGSIRVRQVSAEGREMLLYRLEPGELSILAITSLMGMDSCPADVVAETEVQALSIPPADFHYAVAESPAFRDFVLKALARRLHDTVLCWLKPLPFSLWMCAWVLRCANCFKGTIAKSLRSRMKPWSWSLVQTAKWLVVC